MSLVLTVDFDGGTDGASLTSGTEGSVAQGGVTKYEADAAIHGPMGMRLVTGQADSIAWSASNSGQASLYWKGYTVGTSSSVLWTLRNSATMHCRFRMNSATGKYELTDDANTLVDSSVASINGAQPGRADVRWEYSGGNLTVTVRLYLDTNIEGDTPDETLGPVTFGIPSVINRFYFGSTAISWQYDVDTLRLYDDVTTWPEAFAASVPPPVVVYSMAGNTTNTTATIKAKVTGSVAGNVKCKYSTNSDLSSSTTTIAQAVDGDGYVTFDLTGLTGGTTYYYAFKDVPGGGDPEVDFGDTAHFRTSTNPSGTSQFKMAVGSCVFTNAPNAHQALLNIAAWNPHRFVHLGDAYYDGVSTSTVPAEHRGRWEDQIANVADWKTLLASVSLVYMNSDHELNPDNVETGGSAVAAAFNEFYRQTIPSMPLVVTGTSPVGKYQSWVDSNIRFILIDVKNTERSLSSGTDGPGKTMLGATQLAWLLDELDQPELLKVILCDVPWSHSASIASQYQDKWPSYANERQIIADHITANGINVDFFHGDSHRLSVDETHNAWGGFPVSSCAPLSQTTGGSQFNGLWDETYPSEGAGSSNASQYMRVTYDWLDADTLQRTCSGWDAISDTEKVSMVTTWVREEPPVTVISVNVGGVATEVSKFINVAGEPVEITAISVAP